jgi:hypothetical protein
MQSMSSSFRPRRPVEEADSRASLRSPQTECFGESGERVLWVGSSWGAALRGFVLGVFLLRIWGGIVEGGGSKLNLPKSSWVCRVFLSLVVLASFPSRAHFFCVGVGHLPWQSLGGGDLLRGELSSSLPLPAVPRSASQCWGFFVAESFPSLRGATTSASTALYNNSSC